MRRLGIRVSLLLGLAAGLTMPDNAGRFLLLILVVLGAGLTINDFTKVRERR